MNSKKEMLIKIWEQKLLELELLDLELELKQLFHGMILLHNRS